MRKYPIGIQDFRSLIEGGFLYVDKTKIIHELVSSGKYYFLSRPRRFGNLTFTLLGSYLQSEVHSSKGRCDTVVTTRDYIYALEFKLDESAAAALQQIVDKGYLGPFQHLPQRKIAIGINFSSSEKNVEGVLVRES